MEGIPRVLLYNCTRILVSINISSIYIKLYDYPKAGLKVGDLVVRTSKSLSAELGPGLLDTMYDGLQRPFEVIMLFCVTYIYFLQTILYNIYFYLFIGNV